MDETIDEKNQSVQQGIVRKDSKGVTADAQALQDAFTRVERFFEHRENSADAVALAKEAQARAADVITAAAAGDFEKASSQSIKVAETCTTCHRLYRPLP